MIAALPMYDLPEVRDATDAWWTGLAGHLRIHGIKDVPRELTRPEDPHAVWQAPDLLLAQTCGYPLTHVLAGRVRYVATPAYDIPNCTGPDYCSALIVRADSPAADLADLRETVCAVNGVDSHSGYNVLRQALAPLVDGGGFFTDVVVTGSHRDSVAAVAAGWADLAAIDGVTFSLLSRHVPDETAAVRVLAWSAPAPGLPYITAGETDDATVAAMRQACREAVTDDRLAAVRAVLGLVGMGVLDATAYDTITGMEDDARRQGYPEIK